MNELSVRLLERDVSPEPRTALRDYVLSYADFAFADLVRFRLMFLEDNQATQNAGLKFETVTAAYGEFTRRMTFAIDAHVLSAIEPKRATDVLWAGLHGAVTLPTQHLKWIWASRENFVERTIDTILDWLSREERNRG